MRKDREIGRLDMISARIRPDETLFLEEMSEAFKISKGEVIRAALMIARRLLQDEETGKINKEIWDRFNDTPPPYDFLEAGSVETTSQTTSHAQ
ncbi:hypothetical protein DWX84_09045 [Parabacteroides sp. AF21-43]|jgi:hypothetical protein|uniref:hypothetical protein n=1 Tax=Parabacteroides sp. AF21-43 TaxID=2293115 RepID=UPI000F0100E5|nr:hypothetical protein [Parabacteroides sp. AF21-43]RKU56225.1 hypothetical protein DWX84_09045 [Parabacteroides sp. AF21-43]